MSGITADVASVTTQLTQLSIVNQKVELRQFSSVINTTSVTRLRLQNIQLTNKQFAFLPTMCPNVETLSCANNCLTSAALKTVHEFKSLRQIYLQGNYISDEGVPEILGCKPLRYANLSNNIIFQ